MSNIIKFGRKLAPALPLVIAPLVLILGGCAADEVQLNGKIFDAVGFGGNQPKDAEPRLAARAPIVVPPNLNRLPEPGQQAEAASPEVAALNDPDKKAQQSQAELARQQEAYCQVHYEDAKAHGDETTANLAVGPLGPCKTSIFSALKNWTKGEE
ncbi:MAG: hypothetical protein WC807_11270 [Hyphomicrobium sp.]|jgi:hypothetical protein